MKKRLEKLFAKSKTDKDVILQLVIKNFKLKNN